MVDSFKLLKGLEFDYENVILAVKIGTLGQKKRLYGQIFTSSRRLPRALSKILTNVPVVACFVPFVREE
jgi:hypothetical protein